MPPSTATPIPAFAKPAISTLLSWGLLIALGACAGPDSPDAEEHASSPAQGMPAVGQESPSTVPSSDLFTEQELFWTELSALCGLAFEGEAVEAPQDSDWWTATLVMHVRECTEDVIRIPIHMDEDRSRTWVLTRTPTGLRLKHDHRLADGTPDASNTEYGGDTMERGAATRQEFPADAYSIDAVPARAQQFWYVEVEPGDRFVYGLERGGSELRYRVEFDVTNPVPPPPPPWGFEDPGG